MFERCCNANVNLIVKNKSSSVLESISGTYLNAHDFELENLFGDPGGGHPKQTLFTIDVFESRGAANLDFGKC